MEYFLSLFKKEHSLKVSRKNLFFYFCAFFILNILFFFLMRNSFYENGVYFKYFQSMIKDGDFNIFNQCEGQFDKWMATTFYNHPDYHSPFLASFLLLPFAFFKVFLPIVVGEKLLGMELFFVLAIGAFITLKGYIVGEAEDDKKFKLILYFISLTCATLWQTFVDPSELSMICLIFSTIIFFEFKKSLSDENYSTLLLALTIFFFPIVRIDGLFYGSIVAFLFFINKDFKRSVYIALALIAGLAQLFIVNQIRFGTWTVSNPVILTDRFYLIPYLFGPNGLFIKTPFMLIAVALVIFQLVKTKDLKQRSLIALGAGVILLKFISLNINLSPVTNFLSSRHYITELPFIAWCALLTFRKRTGLLLVFITPFIIYNLYDHASYFLHQTDDYQYFFNTHMAWSVLTAKHLGLQNFFKWRMVFINENQSVIIVLSLISATFLTTIYWLQSKAPNRYRLILMSTLVLTTIVFNGLNLLNNQKNAAVMKTHGDFEVAVIAKGNAVYYDEVLDMIQVAQNAVTNYDIPTQQKLDDFQLHYTRSLDENIVIDPIGFKKDLENGIVRKSFWQLKDSQEQHDFDSLYKSAGTTE